MESNPVLREGRKGSHMAIERQRDRQLFTSLMMPHSPPQNERGAVRRSSATLPRTATINCVSLLPCSHVCQTDQCICLWLQKEAEREREDDQLRFLEQSIPVRVVSRSLRSGRSDRRSTPIFSRSNGRGRRRDKFSERRYSITRRTRSLPGFQASVLLSRLTETLFTQPEMRRIKG